MNTDGRISMIEITDKSKCCGCSACYSICPKGAIKMTFDDEGFRYPAVDMNLCINCNMCEKVCPEIKPYVKQRVGFSEKYAVQNAQETARAQSTAGGFFSIIADYVLDNNGSVFAVGFDGITVAHKEATNSLQLEEMRGSKYVQSSLGDVFNRVKACVHKDKLCLFVGTPCQVNAIEKFMSKDIFKKHLITIDLLCLGVSSPLLYEKWIEYLEKKYNDNLKQVYFRDKSYGYATANVRVIFENRKFIEQCYDAKSLMKTFFMGYNMRPSCYDCSFRCVERVSDFTIGDFHQIGKIYSDFDDDKGTTCVWTHSDTAKRLMQELKGRMRAHLIDDKCSRVLFLTGKLTPIPTNRGSFYSDFNKLEFKDFIIKWAENDLKGNVVNFSRRIINRMPFRSVVFKMMKRMKSKSFQKGVKSAND